MNAVGAQGTGQDIQFIREIVQKSHRRIDPHAFHYVHWGAIVLLWYPLDNWFRMSGRESWANGLMIGALVLGGVLSGLRESLAGRSPRLEGSNTHIARQVSWITAGSLIAAFVLSMLAMGFSVLDEKHVYLVWGLAYANIAFMTGVVYTRDFLLSGIFIFVGVAIAVAFSDYCGFILGPFMGLGMIAPGLLAEKRVRKLREEVRGS